MGLRKYVTASNAAAVELAELLSSEEVTILADDMAALGLRAWVEWQVENESEIEDFVEATPGQRERKKAWHEPVLRRRLVLAGITHCLAAAELLSFFDQHTVTLSPGGSYRGTTSSAGSLYWKIKDTSIPHWPFVFEGLAESPFP